MEVINMKLSSAIITMLFASSLFAQGTNPPPAGGTNPPQQQQPGMPNQQQPGMPNQQQPGMPNQQQPQPGTKGQMGQQPQKDGKNWTPESCQKQIPRLQKAAENCLRIAKEPNRRACFDNLQKQFPPGFMDACREQIAPLKAEIEAKEKAKYPQQNSAIPTGNPNNQQPQGQNPPPSGDKKVDCAKMSNEIRKHADQCLATKDQAKRKACFDKIGQKIQESGAESSCGPAFDQLKSEYQAKEAQMYPGQPSSM